MSVLTSFDVKAGTEVFRLQSRLSNSATVQEKRPCTVCHLDLTDQDILDNQAIECAGHHPIDQECLTHQVRYLEDLEGLKEEGLQCYGELCKERLPFETVLELLEAEERMVLETRLAKALEAGVDNESKSEAQNLFENIEGAFNLTCPKKDCGSTLDNIEGCNAASCSNKKCKADFCYLCLKPQRSADRAHKHVLKHSGDFWERRSGFTERYHWQIARKKLHSLFEKDFKWYHRFLPQRESVKVDDTIRNEVTSRLEGLLKAQDMWPMPAGQTSERWIQEVRNAELHPRKRIKLLQNEYIYRYQMGDRKNATLIKAEVEALGSYVFTSLDWSTHRKNPIFPVENGDDRVPPQFATLGEMYQVGDLIWSGVAAQEATYEVAAASCSGLGEGARLPTNEEYEHLREAMGYPNRYNSTLLTNMDKTSFWTSTPFLSALSGYGSAFFGSVGSIAVVPREIQISFRCVILLI